MKCRSYIDYINYLKNIINDLKTRFPNVYKNRSDLEILADFQHKGGASCLVDFSNNFLISLWFACHNDYSDIGYLLCYDINKDALEKEGLSILSNDKAYSTTIDKLLLETKKTTNYDGKGSFRFWMWKPSNLNERIARQDSVFIFGLEAFKIFDHDIKIIPIPGEWKKNILKALKFYFNITSESIYCDVNGFAFSNDKSKPIETLTSYLSENIFGVKISDEKKGISFDNFQNGISSLFKAEYEISLNYFYQFETSIKSLDLCNRLCPINDKGKCILECSKCGDAFWGCLYMNIVFVELHFSKALSYKHLGKMHNAIYELQESRKYCTDIYKSTDSENYVMYKKYSINKLYKIYDELIELLYDTKKYKIAKQLFSEIQKEMKELSEDNTFKQFYQTVNNELILLNLLSGIEQENMDKLEKYDFELEKQPFYYLLNKYFRLIMCIIKNSNRYDTELKVFGNVVNEIKETNFKKLEIRTKWNLVDIKECIDKYVDNKDIYFKLNEVTTMLDDCLNYINNQIVIKSY